MTAETKHGSGLVCSYPQCRYDGIKFCYCKECDDAIPSFCFKSHEHANSKHNKRDKNDDHHATTNRESGSDNIQECDRKSSRSNSSGGSQADVSTEGARVRRTNKNGEGTIDSVSSSSDDSPMEQEGRGGRVRSVDGFRNIQIETFVTNSDTTATSTASSEEGQAGADNSSNHQHHHHHHHRRHRQVSLPGTPSDAATSITQSSQRREPSRKRRELWAALLTKRPPTSGGGAMKKWYDKIQAVSNLDIPDSAFGISEEGDSSSN